MRKKLPYLAGLLLLALAVLGMLILKSHDEKKGTAFDGARFVLSDGSEDNAPAVHFECGERFV